MKTKQDTAYDRIIRYAMELRKRDYRSALNNWNRDYALLMSRKPRVEDYV